MYIQKKLKENKKNSPETSTSPVKKDLEKEYFEFSFLKFAKLIIIGKNQSEIRETVKQTWWLYLMTFIFAILLILFVGRNILEQVLPLFFN